MIDISERSDVSTGHSWNSVALRRGGARVPGNPEEPGLVRIHQETLLDASRVGLWSRLDPPVRRDGLRQPPGLPGGGRHHRPPPLRLSAGAQMGLDPALLRTAQREARHPGYLRTLAERGCVRPQVLLHQQDRRTPVPALRHLGQSCRRS